MKHSLIILMLSWPVTLLLSLLWHFHHYCCIPIPPFSPFIHICIIICMWQVAITQYKHGIWVSDNITFKLNRKPWAMAMAKAMAIAKAKATAKSMERVTAKPKPMTKASASSKATTKETAIPTEIAMAKTMVMAKPNTKAIAMAKVGFSSPLTSKGNSASADGGPRSQVCARETLRSALHRH